MEYSACPLWFVGTDIIIDLLSLFVLVLIAFTANSYYNMSRERKYNILSLSFYALALSMAMKVMINFDAYYVNTLSHEIGIVTIFLIKLLNLLGFFLLFLLYNKMDKVVKYLVAFLILLITLLTNSFIILHLTILFFLIPIVYSLRCKACTFNQSTLVSGFIFIALSHALFLFQNQMYICYVLAEIFQLVGFTFLFLAVMRTKSEAKQK